MLNFQFETGDIHKHQQLYGTTAIDNSSPKNAMKCRPLNVIGDMRLFGFLWKGVTNPESFNSANSLLLIS
jgi:hypothetical protein